MVLLTITSAAKAAIDEYCRDPNKEVQLSDALEFAQTGTPIEHDELIRISQYLTQRDLEDRKTAREWRLDTLMRGAFVYRPPPPPKSEPTPEYKALMHRLRQQEEQSNYERMLNPPPKRETFQQRFPGAASPYGHDTSNDVDEVSYEDVNRQMILIINVLVSIVACSVAVWWAARRWSVPQRLGLSFATSTIVAVAEVAIYMGYLRRIKDAKVLEANKVERKEIIDTWVIDGKTSGKDSSNGNLRARKGKHR